MMDQNQNCHGEIVDGKILFPEELEAEEEVVLPSLDRERSAVEGIFFLCSLVPLSHFEFDSLSKM